MKEYIFTYEGRKYITDASNQMDAEEKFMEEFGEDPIDCKIVKDLDSLIYSEEEIVYF